MSWSFNGYTMTVAFTIKNNRTSICVTTKLNNTSAVSKFNVAISGAGIDFVSLYVKIATQLRRGVVNKVSRNRVTRSRCNTSLRVYSDRRDASARAVTSGSYSSVCKLGSGYRVILAILAVVTFASVMFAVTTALSANLAAVTASSAS